MKQITLLLFFALFGYNSLLGQNPNWTFPGQYLNHDIPQLQNLPQPSGSDVYQGVPAEYVHAGYTGPDGELQFFTVDEHVYDKNGYEVGEMIISDVPKAGFNERLILPMGDDCKRYGILYRSAATGCGYSSPLCPQALFMAIYNTEGTNTWNEDDPVIGALEQFPGFQNTLIDISRRDGLLYFQNGLLLHGFTNSGTGPVRQQMANMHIAASDLIDGCYYRVYFFDGNNLIKYHLTDEDLEYQGVIQNVPNTGLSSTLRSEMELIKLPTGDYRIAIPANNDENPSGVSRSIVIYDIDGASGDITSGSEVILDYRNAGQSISPSEIYGMEFDQTGQYLYVTNSTNSVHINLLEVYDVDGSAYVTTPISMSSLAPFQQSFIERYGNELYLSSTSHLGRITNTSSPGSAMFFGTFQAFSGTYGNDAGNSFFQRQLLPEQLDMPYPDPVEDMSCDCCKDNIADVCCATAPSDTWTPGSNPFTSGGADVYIGDELRIPAGTTLTISDMNFYFGNDAKVIIEKGNGSQDGGHLIMVNTLFTADLRCNERNYKNCQEGENCQERFWQGVRVIGDENADQLTTGGVQGRLTMKGQSEIEYAYIGARAGNEDCTDCGGGILDIIDSKFKDNLRGVLFDSYVRLSGGNETFNRSYIRLTNFTRTADVPADTKLFFHLGALDCGRIILKGNTYQNEAWAGYTPSYRGVGIYAKNSTIDEQWYCQSTDVPCSNKVRSVFANLSKAIDATSTVSSRTLKTGYGVYRNNRIGIQASNLLRPIIVDNDFAVINETNSSGVKLISCDQYAVENNFFTAMATSPVAWMFGITVQSSGPGNNELYRNRFENITIGIVSSGQNADIGPLNDPNDCGSAYNKGLRWKCNRFDQTIPYADIFVYSGNVSDDQGECDPIVLPARNIFSHTGSGAFDILVRVLDLLECSVPFDINYEYNEIPAFPTPVQARLEPLVYTATYVNAIECNAIPGEYLPSINDCPVKTTSLDDPSEVLNIAKSGNKEITMQDMIQEAAILYGGSKSEDDADSEWFAQLEYNFWSQITQAYQWDTLGLFSAEDVFDLINTYEPESSGQKFASFLAQKLGQETPDWISSEYVITEDVENLPVANDLGELPIVLNDVIDEGQLNSVSYVAALNELYATYGQVYETVIPEPLDLDLPASFPADEDKANKMAEGGKAITMQPNPFTDAFNMMIDTDRSYTNLQVIVYDILGKQLLNKNYGEMSQIEIDGSAFPSGVLIYAVFIDGELLDTGRIVKAE